MSDLSRSVRRLLARHGFKPSPELAEALAEISARMRRGQPDEEQDRVTSESRLNQLNRELAGKIGGGLPPDVGFALLLFNYGEGGFMSWISNAHRSDMIKAVMEWLERVRRIN